MDRVDTNMPDDGAGYIDTTSKDVATELTELVGHQLQVNWNPYDERMIRHAMSFHLSERYIIVPKPQLICPEPVRPPPTPLPGDPPQLFPSSPPPTPQAPPRQVSAVREAQQQTATNAQSSFLSTASSESLPTYPQDHTESQPKRTPAPSRAASPSTALSLSLPAYPSANTHSRSTGTPKASGSKKASSSRSRTINAPANTNSRSVDTARPHGSEQASASRRAASNSQPRAQEDTSSQTLASNSQPRVQKASSSQTHPSNPQPHAHLRPSKTASACRTVFWAGVEVSIIPPTPTSSPTASTKRSFDDYEDGAAGTIDAQSGKRSRSNHGLASSVPARPVLTASRQGTQSSTARSRPRFVGPGGRRVLGSGDGTRPSKQAGHTSAQDHGIKQAAQTTRSTSAAVAEHDRSTRSVSAPEGQTNASFSLPSFQALGASLTESHPSSDPPSNRARSSRYGTSTAAPSTWALDGSITPLRQWSHADSTYGCVSRRDPSTAVTTAEQVIEKATAVASTRSSRQHNSIHEGSQDSAQMSAPERLNYALTHHPDGTRRTSEDAPPPDVTTGFRWASAEQEAPEVQRLEELAQFAAEQQIQSHQDDALDIPPEAQEELRSIVTRDDDGERLSHIPTLRNLFGDGFAFRKGSTAPSKPVSEKLKAPQQQQSTTQQTVTNMVNNSQTSAREQLEYAQEHNTDGTRRARGEGPPRNVTQSFYWEEADEEAPVLEQLEQTSQEEQRRMFEEERGCVEELEQDYQDEQRYGYEETQRSRHTTHGNAEVLKYNSGEEEQINGHAEAQRSHPTMHGNVEEQEYSSEEGQANNHAPERRSRRTEHGSVKRGREPEQKQEYEDFIVVDGVEHPVSLRAMSKRARHE